jgi:SAM-dependent methyltransferase
MLVASCRWHFRTDTSKEANPLQQASATRSLDGLHPRPRPFQRMGTSGHSSLAQLIDSLAVPPAPWAPGEPGLWTDAHIGQQMLAAHLDPNSDAASRRPQEIARTVAWLGAMLGLGQGSDVLDLGCGPGLYARQLSELGCRVTGVDYSRSSIEYARANDPASEYLLQDYLTLDFDAGFDAVLLIYGDFCVLDQTAAAALLRVVERALKPGGCFVFDVTTRLFRSRRRRPPSWSAHPRGGFWRKGPYLLLKSNHDYPEASLALEQYAIVEPGGGAAVYRNWFRDYDRVSIAHALAGSGLTVEGTFDGFSGAGADEGSEWIAVVARRPPDENRPA